MMKKTWHITQIKVYIIIFCVSFEFLSIINTYALNKPENNIKAVEINNNTSYVNLGYHIKYFEDKNNNITIDKLISGKLDEKFFINKAQFVNFGYSNSTYWLKFSLSTINQKKNKSIDWLLKAGSPFIHNIELFLVTSTTNYIRIMPGLNEQMKMKKCKNNIFVIPTKPSQIYTYYLKVNADFPIKIPLEIYSYCKFYYKNKKLFFNHGIYIGIMIFLICINTFLFHHFKVKIFLYNIFLIISLTLLDSIFNFYIYDLMRNILHDDVFKSKINILTSISIYIVCFAITLLNRNFISNKFNNKSYYNFCYIFIYGSLILCIISFTLSGSILTKISISFYSIYTSVVLISYIFILKKEDNLTYIVIIGWIPFFITTLIYSLTCFGLLNGFQITGLFIQYSEILIVFMFTLVFYKHSYIINELNNQIKYGDQNKQIENLRSFKESAITINKNLKNISNNTSEFISKYSDINNQKDHINELSSVVGNYIKDMTDSAKLINSDIKDVSENVEHIIIQNTSVDNLIVEMKKSIVETQKSVLNTSKISENALVMTKSATDSIKNFNESIHSIDNITEDIKKISERIDILAVNAAIEAASAGELGKGFSVVANEISKFADQSADAAKDIATQIVDVNIKSDDFVNISKDLYVIIEKLYNSSLSFSNIINNNSNGVNEISLIITKLKSMSCDISSLIDQSKNNFNLLNENISRISGKSKYIFKFIDEVIDMISEINKHNKNVIQEINEIKNISKTIH